MADGEDAAPSDHEPDARRRDPSWIFRPDQEDGGVPMRLGDGGGY